MYLLRLDEHNTVIECAGAATSPAVLQRLDSSYMLSHASVPVGHTFDPVTRAFGPPAAARRITRLALLQRITMTEHVAIELASIHDPAGSTAQQTMAATLRKMLQLVNAANWIDLDRPDTRALIVQIEQFGLLAPGRALEILDGAITDIERPEMDTPRAAEA